MIDITISEIDVAKRIIDSNAMDYVLSVVSPNTILEQSSINHKIMRMEDVAVVCPNAPTKKQIEEIIEFGKSIPDNSKVLIHCLVGQSRSPAAAIIILCARGYSPEDAYSEIFKIRDIMLPNMLMLHYADEIFGFDKLQKLVAEQQKRIMVPKEPIKLTPQSIDEMKKLMNLFS